MDSVKRFGGLVVAVLTLCVLLAEVGLAADSIKGRVLGGGAPIAKSTVTLWEASADAPSNLHRPRPMTMAGLKFAPRAPTATRSYI